LVEGGFATARGKSSAGRGEARRKAIIRPRFPRGLLDSRVIDDEEPLLKDPVNAWIVTVVLPEGRVDRRNHDGPTPDHRNDADQE
jgi:hypothetical protein